MLRKFFIALLLLEETENQLAHAFISPMYKMKDYAVFYSVFRRKSHEDNGLERICVFIVHFIPKNASGLLGV